ncbi:putative LRR receptor-like serine/threonine-protein kinase [Iris pallida]|uniref:LRR receptor-like serine/threonine-protein kinase n=1 Tax=Iris pallida TaxID=29817 RepID=A0AAX6GH44_IRIPA|nr:putative LRR receptor-like serine/threonine-protein kinase [Iris pallida]
MAALNLCATGFFTSRSSPASPVISGSKIQQQPSPNLNISRRAPLRLPLANSPPVVPAAHPSAAAAASSPFDLSPPPIDYDPVNSGAKFFDDISIEKVGDDNLAIDAALNGVAVVDLSHFGRIRVTGEDRIQFLHNQTTAKFDSLSAGEGCDTVFVTPTARTIDLAHAWVMKNAITLLVSPATCASIAEMLKKYIFYADNVEVHDITKQTCFIVLVGPKSNQVMKNLKLDALIGKSYGTHRHYNVGGMPITVGVGSVLLKDGYSFLLSPSSLGPVWKALLSLGAIPVGASAWERLRVLQGRPAAGKELTDDFNVLEAGLWSAVSVDKGCYKGQETISRLITYGGIKQKLWGIELSGSAEPGSTITTAEDGKKVGVLTSYSVGREAGEHVGLGYVRKQVGPNGKVRIGDVAGTLVHVPFLSYPPQ